MISVLLLNGSATKWRIGTAFELNVVEPAVDPSTGPADGSTAGSTTLSSNAVPILHLVADPFSNSTEIMYALAKCGLGPSFLALANRMISLFWVAMYPALIRLLSRQSERPDLIIADYVSTAGMDAALRFRIPLIINRP